MNALTRLDAQLSTRLALPTDAPRWRFAAKIAHLGDGTLIFGGLALAYVWGWFFHNPALRIAVFSILLSLIITAVVVFAIKYTLRRERPRDPTGFVTIKYDKYSFPSGHSARMSCLAIAVLLYTWPLGLALLALSFAIAAARVIIGVHYLGDVLVGLALGGIVSLAVGAFVM